MKTVIKFFIFLSIFLFSIQTYARIYIPINQPSDKKFPIAVSNLTGTNSLTNQIPQIIKDDLTLSGYFNIIPNMAFEDFVNNKDIDVNSIRFNFWTSLEAQALVKGSVEIEDNNFIVQLRLFDPFLQEMLIGKQYVFPQKEKKERIREVAHQFSDEIMKTLTGVKGIFNTKITYTAITGKGKKEIYIMDMDGHNNRRVTNLQSISLGSTWSPDGSKLAFTSYHRKNPDLYIINTNGKELKQLIGGEGSKITPSWSPDGNEIAFSSALDGNSQIYKIPFPSNNKIRKITNIAPIDIAPSWSHDGTQIVFATERYGNLHLAKMNSNGGSVQRLTFVGYQNDMPSWSPQGDKIAFAGRDMGAFDIFIMNPDGSNIQRLTIRNGNNEHPSWSPDGRFIVFSSTRSGDSGIYIMRADGSNQKRISTGNGILPEWGPAVN